MKAVYKSGKTLANWKFHQASSCSTLTKYIMALGKKVRSCGWMHSDTLLFQHKYLTLSTFLTRDILTLYSLKSLAVTQGYFRLLSSDILTLNFSFKRWYSDILEILRPHEDPQVWNQHQRRCWHQNLRSLL